MPRRAPRRDANERQIIDELRGMGAIVEQIDKEDFPDLVVIWRGYVMLVEVKSEKGQLSEGQREWHEYARDRSEWVIVARCTQDVIDAYEERLA